MINQLPNRLQHDPRATMNLCSMTQGLLWIYAAWPKGYYEFMQHDPRVTMNLRSMTQGLPWIYAAWPKDYHEFMQHDPRVTMNLCSMTQGLLWIYASMHNVPKTFMWPLQTKNVNWTYISRLEDLHDVFWTSYVRSIDVLCLRGDFWDVMY